MHSITISRYHNTRNWAVYFNGELLAVTVYKKGAHAVAQKLHGLLALALPTALHAV